MTPASERFDWTVSPGGKPAGQVRVPGDKSISHRSVMLGSLATGRTDVTGFLDGEDCLCTMKAFQAMGVSIERLSDTSLRVDGVGLHGLTAPAHDLDLGNSGTSMRLMSGLLAAQKFPSTLVGDASLSRRPMRRVIDPLARMGAHIDSQDGKAPLHIRPVAGLQGIAHASKVASAQVKSCILLAGLYAQGETSVTEPEASRDHTERMLQAFGVQLEASHGRAALRGGQQLVGTAIPVPADISSAAFFMLAAAIVPGSEIVLRDVGINPTRTGVIDILRAMGAEIELLDPRTFGGEPVSDIRVRGRGLRGIAVDPALVASAIDEFPAVFVAAACAEGETLISGAEELRVKESDRIQTMVDGLVSLGIDAVATPDGARIRGGQLRGGEINSHGDHRVAMSFAMGALRSSGPIRILDVANVNTSFPRFAEKAQAMGLAIAPHRAT
ncbi:3-phosphoshikimate 1-carboxyvinyltransferase [Panacagrimonas perspica]|uniref:3-phosphoshikimate 1-carboxyvinyltransferase n=1 Tax=Panacagrimonas perspica TaxID=381431 RepID=A0A4R7PC26_9GAMM|nr:3-phosphoshikimate 1-carboxyvinyltransferase [Panacagrimonas perspica]TDU31262.1 3-phosphoshikimate 1-carboxyvinyltransferase [Panacagrimonas perspica]THD02610.1 3-phosphoshikimate 1-carboxyvinyltransferase [Panacagrimonas perspica]